MRLVCFVLAALASCTHKEPPRESPAAASASVAPSVSAIPFQPPSSAFSLGPNQAAPTCPDPVEFSAQPPAAKLAACRAIVGYDGKLEKCTATSLGNGSLFLLSLVTACAGDSCTTRGYACSKPTGGKLVPLTDVDVAGGIDADPSGRYLVVDRIQPGAGGMTVGLDRVDVTTLARTRFAACMSPRLSPRGHWFSCRNRSGDVLRVPIDGGKLEIIARSGVAESDVDWAPQSYAYPAAVGFPERTRVAFSTDVRAKNGDVRSTAGSALWEEAP